MGGCSRRSPAPSPVQRGQEVGLPRARETSLQAGAGVGWCLRTSRGLALGSHSRPCLSSGLWPLLGPTRHPRSAGSGPS